MQTLIYGNRKEPDSKWDISTPEQRAAAFLNLFNYLKKEWQVYHSDYWGETADEQTKQKRLYKAACAGDAVAAESLLKLRINYEYENWRIVESANGTGEPRTVVARQPDKITVTELRRSSDSGQYHFRLSNGEEIEIAYLPIHTTRKTWEDGHVVASFIREAIYEKIQRESYAQKTISELLSHMNYMRLTLHFTLHPEFMPLGSSLPVWQRRSLETAESLIGQHGDTAIEKLKEKKVRPTELLQAQNALSEAFLLLESAVRTAEHPNEHDIKRLKERIAKLKKGMVEEL